MQRSRIMWRRLTITGEFARSVGFQPKFPPTDMTNTIDNSPT